MTGWLERQAEDAGVTQVVAAVAVHLASATSIRVGRQVDALGAAVASHLLGHVHETAGDALPAVVLVDDVLDPVLLADEDDHRRQQHRPDDLALVDGGEQPGAVVEHVVQPLRSDRACTGRELRKETVDVIDVRRLDQLLAQLHVLKFHLLLPLGYERL